MSAAPTTTPLPESRVTGWRCWILLSLGVHLSLTGVLTAFYHSAIVPWYYFKIAALTVVAYVTGRSFVVRLPDRLPRFIARPSSRDVRTFVLSKSDVDFICSRTGPNLPLFDIRQWRPAEEVLTPEECEDQSDIIHRRRLIRLDLSLRRLVGPRLTQGQGLVGHGICVALVEEIGRWPGARKVLAGRFFSWNEDTLILGQFPVHFATVAGLEEIIRTPTGYLRHVWQDLESGLVQGLKIDLYPQGGYPPQVDLYPLGGYAPTIASSSFAGTGV